MNEQKSNTVESLILKFKKGRQVTNKVTITAGVNTRRMSNIDDAIERAAPIYAILNQSERMDFKFYLLEKFLSSSESIPLTMQEDEIR